MQIRKNMKVYNIILLYNKIKYNNDVQLTMRKNSPTKEKKIRRHVETVYLT